MICAGGPSEKASFPDILAIASMEEKLARLEVNNQTIFHHMYTCIPISLLICSIVAVGRVAFRRIW